MAAPLGNTNRAGAAAITRVLLEEVRAERFDLLRKGVRAQLKKAAEGDLNSLAWCYNRIAGLPRAQVDVASSDAREIDQAALLSIILAARRADSEDVALIQQEPALVENDSQVAPGSRSGEPPTHAENSEDGGVV